MLEAFAGVDAILHAGDIACRAVLDQLATLAPVHAVYGNVDPPELCGELPDRLALSFGGVHIGLTHGHLGRGATTADRALAHCLEAARADVVVFGHSHVPCNERRGAVLLFNPGSPTERRHQPWASYGLLVIEAGRVEGQIVPLAQRA
jgi:putative phosphoesterase